MKTEVFIEMLRKFLNTVHFAIIIMASGYV